MGQPQPQGSEPQYMRRGTATRGIGNEAADAAPGIRTLHSLLKVFCWGASNCADRTADLVWCDGFVSTFIPPARRGPSTYGHAESQTQSRPAISWMLGGDSGRFSA